MFTTADRPAQIERQALCDTAREAGPAAPTLCSPWTVADLLAHLVIRERRPDLAAGMFVPALAGRLESAQSAMAAGDFSALLDRVRSGPPIWHPAQIGVVDDQLNLLEMFVHHEDIRRAADWQQRQDAAYGSIGPALDTALRSMARLLFRRARTGVVLVPSSGDPITAKGPTRLGSVTLSGATPELLLYANGRARVADVVADGAPDAVAALAASRLGLA